MLNSMQHNWVHVLCHSRDKTPDGLRGEHSGKRFELYRASLQENLGNALSDTYPVINKLVGDRFFQAMTRRYIARHPSQHGDIHLYGEQFADFLCEFEPARALSYMPDVARLEWRVHQAFHAADAPVVNISRLAILSAMQLADHIILLQPSLQLMQSNFPLQDIWRVNQENFKEEQAVNLDAGGVNLLVFRQELDIVLLRLSLSDYQFVQYLLESKNLAIACEKVLQWDAGFNMATMLHRLFEQQLVSSFLSAGNSKS